MVESLSLKGELDEEDICVGQRGEGEDGEEQLDSQQTQDSEGLWQYDTKFERQQEARLWQAVEEDLISEPEWLGDKPTWWERERHLWWIDRGDLIEQGGLGANGEGAEVVDPTGEEQKKRGEEETVKTTPLETS